MKRQNIFLIIIVVITINMFAQTNNGAYTSKYNISSFDTFEVIKYFDIGWAWREETIMQGNTLVKKRSKILKNPLKWARARAKFKQIETEVRKKFDSAMDKCYARIINITNVAGKPVESIKTGLRTYIEKIKLKPDRTSEKNVKINFKFNDMYLNYYNLKTFRQIQHNGKNYNVGIGDFDTWTGDKGVAGGTLGDGVINLVNGYKDYQVRTFSAQFVDRFSHNTCRYELFESYLRDSSWLALYQSKGLNQGALRTASIETLLAHEVIHNALRQEAPGSYWKDLLKGRWGDEATVEDIQLKLFPGNRAEAVYEAKFHFAAWWYRVMQQGGRPKEFHTHLFMYYDGNVQRQFNPVYLKGKCELKYESTNNIDIITTVFKKVNNVFITINLSKADKSFCDDCRDEQLFDYVIPYYSCCGSGREHIMF